jgi:hypothetical protein
MNESTVPPDPQPHLNADQLEQTIAVKRARLAELATDEQRTRRSRALDHMAAYAQLLREAANESSGVIRRASEPGVGYTFKVEFDDGRWDIEEKELHAVPRVGDVLSFADGRSWRVRASQLVRPRPSGKPAREFFVCAPSV